MLDLLEFFCFFLWPMGIFLFGDILYNLIGTYCLLMSLNIYAPEVYQVVIIPLAIIFFIVGVIKGGVYEKETVAMLTGIIMFWSFWW